ncbi:2,4-diacetylphloroglucinol biosynthesis protein [Bacillus cereus]|nr:2,4-diacetylphloroglucinol biosynthesis protein [Bacillus cereus]PGP75138.1 2,4-diacetylphloroglucinol biosynthesis protein [Bacillus cereus]
MSQQYPEQIPNPMVASTYREWREQGGKYRLEGSVCEKCGSQFFPRRRVCANCHSLELESYQFNHTGAIQNVINSGIPQVAVMGYGENSPRYIASIKLLDGPVIIGEIIDVFDTSKLKMGAKVKMVVRKQARSTNLNWNYAYKFKLL